MQVYFAGELFSFKHLLGNAALASSIDYKSDFKYTCILPQDLEQRDTTPIAIKNQDLKTLISCDVALFNFDSQPVDDGTVVEFMVAKMLDIPSILLRTDFRNAGDQKADPWNLMMSNFPRTEVIVIDSISEILKVKNRDVFTGCRSFGANQVAYINMAMEDLAQKIITTFDKLIETKSILPGDQCQRIYEWVIKSSGFSNTLSSFEIEDIIKNKRELGLLKNGN